MNPQGSLPFNAETFKRLADQINAVQSCAELQALTDEAMQSANALLAGIGAQMAALQPMLALLSPPGINPADIVKWINGLISAVIQPYVKPMLVLPVQIAQITAAVADLQAAIASASSRIGSCSIEMPPVTVPELPKLPEVPDLPSVEPPNLSGS